MYKYLIIRRLYSHEGKLVGHEVAEDCDSEELALVRVQLLGGRTHRIACYVDFDEEEELG